MFLNQLSRQEKKMFLSLCVHAAKANDILSAEEKILISEYCTEMQLPPMEQYEAEPLETVADYFSMTEEHVKKIVLLEILGLVYADGEFDASEDVFVKRFADAIGVTKENYHKLHEAITEYYRVCRNMAEAVA